MYRSISSICGRNNFWYHNLMLWPENHPMYARKHPDKNAGSHTLVVAGILVKVRDIYRLRQQAYTGRRLFFAKPETFSSRKPPIPMSVGA